NLPESQPKKSHHEDTKTRRNPLRFFASSCLRGEQDACAPRRTHRNPCQVAKNEQDVFVLMGAPWLCRFICGVSPCPSPCPVLEGASSVLQIVLPASASLHPDRRKWWERHSWEAPRCRLLGHTWSESRGSAFGAAQSVAPGDEPYGQCVAPWSRRDPAECQKTGP